MTGTTRRAVAQVRIPFRQLNGDVSDRHHGRTVNTGKAVRSRIENERYLGVEMPARGSSLCVCHKQVLEFWEAVDEINIAFAEVGASP